MCAMPSSKRLGAFEGRRGFTLLEIVVVVALLGIIAAALYSSYFTVLRARERVSLGMESRRELAATMDLLRREIAASVYSRSNKRLCLVVEDRDRFGRPASTIELTTMVPKQSQGRKESGVVNVRYRLIEKEKRLILTRRERDSMIGATEAAEYPQMEEISSFLVECYDGSRWLKTWHTELNGSLPKMIRVTLQVDEGGKPVEFSMLSAPKIDSL